jgi:hypothetical protein
MPLPVRPSLDEHDHVHHILALSPIAPPMLHVPAAALIRSQHKPARKQNR